MKSAVVMSMEATKSNFSFSGTIESELSKSQIELSQIEEKIEENIKTLKNLQVNCDKIDYSLAASSGALCGIIDIFLVGKPGESPLGKITDKWFSERTKDFAKMCGWDSSKNDTESSAIRFLEKKFKVPYDQRGAGDAGKEVFGLTPGNHHFKSLAHNPSLLGLFFSILNQFQHTSTFVSDGQVITLNKVEDGFELQGSNVMSKLFCGFANWIGHLMSDISGSSGSKQRGTGIPSPLWTWINDVIAIKSIINEKFDMNIPITKFDETMNKMAVKMFEKGFDARFQATQTIPVILNEMIIRLFYTIRRALKYFATTEKEDMNYSSLWQQCEPFSNSSVKRMLTVGHGVFCLADTSDALIRGFAKDGGNFNALEFFLRLNVAGVGRFSISLYGETVRSIKNIKNKKELEGLSNDKKWLDNYIEGLKILGKEYDDTELLSMLTSFTNSELYIEVFNSSISLAENRHVPADKIIRNKPDIDNYFMRGKR